MNECYTFYKTNRPIIGLNPWFENKREPDYYQFCSDLWGHQTTLRRRSVVHIFNFDLFVWKIGDKFSPTF